MREKLALFSCLILVTGLVMSKFLISTGIIMLLLSALLTKNYGAAVKKLLNNKANLAPIGIFGIVLISGLYSENRESYLGLITVMLPFLILPAAFGLLPVFDRKNINRILFYLVLMMSGSAIWVLWNYLSNYEYYQQLITVSKALPTPQDDHIRYSLMLVLSIFAAFRLLKDRFYLINQAFEKYLLLLLSGFLFIMLHILSVRSGLFAFYAAMFALCIRIIIRRKKLIYGFGLLLMMMIVPVLAFYSLPSLRQKFYLMKYNWDQYRAGNVAGLSDTQRLLSYQLAIEVASKNPWTGVGAGDLEDEMKKLYNEKHPELGHMLPHNQFISFYAATGILGLLAFTFFFFQPLFYKKAYRSDWFLIFFIVICSSLLTENTLYVSIGLNMYLFFLLLHINRSTLQQARD